MSAAARAAAMEKTDTVARTCYRALRARVRRHLCESELGANPDEYDPEKHPFAALWLANETNGHTITEAMDWEQSCLPAEHISDEASKWHELMPKDPRGNTFKEHVHMLPGERRRIQSRFHSLFGSLDRTLCACASCGIQDASILPHNASVSRSDRLKCKRMQERSLAETSSVFQLSEEEVAWRKALGTVELVRPMAGDDMFEPREHPTFETFTVDIKRLQSCYEYGDALYHFHPELVSEDKDGAGPTVMLCPDCDTVNTAKGTANVKAPKNSIAAGVDFGRFDRIEGLQQPTDVELCILADYRPYHVVQKVRAPNSNSTASDVTRHKKLTSHHILFMHEGPTVNLKTIRDRLDLLFETFKVNLLGPAGTRDALAGRAIRMSTLQARAHVIYNHMLVRRAVSDAHKNCPLEELAHIKEERLQFQMRTDLNLLPSIEDVHGAVRHVTRDLVLQARYSSDMSVEESRKVHRSDVTKTRTDDSKGDSKEAVSDGKKDDENDSGGADTDVARAPADAESAESGTLTEDGVLITRVALLQTGLQAGDVRKATYHAVERALGEDSTAEGAANGGPESCADGGPESRTEQADDVFGREDEPQQDEPWQARVPRSEDPASEFELNGMQLMRTFWYLFPLQRGLQHVKGTAPRKVTRHLMLQYTRQFEEASDLCFVLANQIQRHASISSVSGKAKNSSKAFRGIVEAVNQEGMPEKLRAAKENPHGPEASEVAATFLPFLSICAAPVPWGAIERGNCISELLACARLYGPGSLFFTMAPDDAHHPTSMRLSLRVVNNDSFPAVDCQGAFLEALRSGSDSHSYEGGSVALDSTSVLGLAAGHPAATSTVYGHLVQAFFAALLGLDPKDKKTRAFCQRTKGLFGRPLGAYAVTECSGRLALHMHGIFFGGLMPRLLTHAAKRKDFCEALAAAIDTQYQGGLPFSVHFEDTVRRAMEVPVKRCAAYGYDVARAASTDPHTRHRARTEPAMTEAELLTRHLRYASDPHEGEGAAESEEDGEDGEGGEGEGSSAFTEDVHQTQVGVAMHTDPHDDTCHKPPGGTEGCRSGLPCHHCPKLRATRAVNLVSAEIPTHENEHGEDACTQHGPRVAAARPALDADPATASLTEEVDCPFCGSNGGKLEIRALDSVEFAKAHVDDHEWYDDIQKGEFAPFFPPTCDGGLPQQPTVWEVGRPVLDSAAAQQAGFSSEAIAVLEKIQQMTTGGVKKLSADAAKELVKEMIDQLPDGVRIALMEQVEVWKRLNSLSGLRAKRLILAWRELRCRNASLVMYNEVMTSVLRCNTAPLLLGASEAARSAMFYMVKYITKESTERDKSLSVLCDAMENISKWKSKADDAETNQAVRTSIHFLQRACNSLHAEISDTQAVSLLLDQKAHISSESFEYNAPWQIMQFALRTQREQQEAAEQEEGEDEDSHEAGSADATQHDDWDVEGDGWRETWAHGADADEDMDEAEAWERMVAEEEDGEEEGPKGRARREAGTVMVGADSEWVLRQKEEEDGGAGGEGAARMIKVDGELHAIEDGHNYLYRGWELRELSQYEYKRCIKVAEGRLLASQPQASPQCPTLISCFSVTITYTSCNSP